MIPAASLKPRGRRFQRRDGGTRKSVANPTSVSLLLWMDAPGGGKLSAVVVCDEIQMGLSDLLSHEKVSVWSHDKGGKSMLSAGQPTRGSFWNITEKHRVLEPRVITSSDIKSNRDHLDPCGFFCRLFRVRGLGDGWWISFI